MGNYLISVYFDVQKVLSVLAARYVDKTNQFLHVCQEQRMPLLMKSSIVVSGLIINDK